MMKLGVFLLEMPHEPVFKTLGQVTRKLGMRRVILFLHQATELVQQPLVIFLVASEGSITDIAHHMFFQGEM